MNFTTNNFIVKYAGCSTYIINTDYGNGKSSLSADCNKSVYGGFDYTYNPSTGVLTAFSGNVDVNDGFCLARTAIPAPYVYLVVGNITSI